MPAARCSWLSPSTTPWLPPDRRWPWPHARPAESYTAAAADTTTSTPAGLTTRTCCGSRYPSCAGTPRCPTTDTIPPHLPCWPPLAPSAIASITPRWSRFGPRLQVELLNTRKWATTLELAAAMADYIDNFYNPERPHSYLGNIS